MTDRKRKHETKARDTLRRAKRAGYRVYPAFVEDDVRAFVGDGNFRTAPARNYDYS